MPAPSDLFATLERTLRARQALRLPSVAASVVRDGQLVWAEAVGLADCEGELAASTDTQYRVGSITKVFTAIALMALAQEGRLDLDDRLEAHIPGTAHLGATLRRMLAHLSGIQREPGEMFISGRAPSAEELLASLEAYEQALPAARAHHYSNLAYALLGELVSRVSGVPYTRFVEERVFAPLGLSRTTWTHHPPFAQGYLVDEFAGTVAREPQIELGGVSSMGQLWSTVGDLGVLASFLAGDGQGVLEPAILDQMWNPQSMLDPEHWLVGWGLGIELASHEGRVYGGHGGAMPGFLAGLHVHRASGIGAVVLTNSGTSLPTREFCLELAGTTIERWPPDIQPWRPEPEPPASVRALLGHWWSEGNEFVFSWREGRLTARPLGAPSWAAPSLFEPLEDGSYRVIAGRERGERLRIDGERLLFGGYPFTRRQESSPG